MVFVPKCPKVCREITLEMYWIFASFTFPQKPFIKWNTYLHIEYLQIVLKVNHCSKICIHTQWQCTNRFYSMPLVVLEVDCKTNFTLLHSQTFDLRTMSTSKWSKFEMVFQIFITFLVRYSKTWLKNKFNKLQENYIS